MQQLGRVFHKVNSKKKKCIWKMCLLFLKESQHFAEQMNHKNHEKIYFCELRTFSS